MPAPISQDGHRTVLKCCWLLAPEYELTNVDWHLA